MKIKLFLIAFSFLATKSIKAQTNPSNNNDSINGIVGTYQFEQQKYIIRKRDDKFLLFRLWNRCYWMDWFELLWIS